MLDYVHVINFLLIIIIIVSDGDKGQLKLVLILEVMVIVVMAAGGQRDAGSTSSGLDQRPGVEHVYAV